MPPARPRSSSPWFPARRRPPLERTSTRIGPLLAYLARPSEKPTDGACPAIAVLPPWLFLLDDAGRYVAPAIPRDACGLPLGW